MRRTNQRLLGLKSFPSIRAVRWAVAISPVLVLASSATANSELDVNTTATDLTSAASYTPPTLPTTTSDVAFTNSTYNATTFTINGNTALGIGTLNDLDATQSLLIQNSTVATAASLTLNGGGNTVSGSAPADLLYVAPGGNLTIQNGAGTLGLTLTAGGNFDVAGIAAVSSIISGAGGITKTGSGTLTLSGVNTFGGGFTLSTGVVSIAANTALGGTSGTGGAVTLNGGTLRLTAGATNTHAFTIGAGGAAMNVVAGTGQYYFNTANALLGSGALTVTGSGTLTKNSGNVRVDHTNTFSGNLNVKDGGIFEYGVANAIASGAAININSQGEFALQNGVTLSNAITVDGGRLSFENGNGGVYSGPITINSGGAEITLQDWYGSGVHNGTISSTMTGDGAITVDAGTGGGGTLTFQGFNATASASNITVITNSTLAVNSSTGTPAASVARGNNLTLNSGNLAVTGVASQTTNDTFASLNVGDGSNTITLTPNAAANAQLTFGSVGIRAVGGWVALNSGTLGGNPAANVSNLLFTTMPSGANVVGGGGALGSSNSSVIPWFRNAGGSNNIYTYDATRGVTAVTGQVAFASAAATDNTTGVGTLTANKTVNSMVAGGNVVMAGNTLTVTSGAIICDTNLTIGSDTATPGTLNFDTAEAQLTSRNARTLTINSAITGSGGLTYVGFRSNTNPALILAGANTYTGQTTFYGYGGTTNVMLTNSLALQNTTLNHMAYGYNMTFGNGGTSGQTAYTFGGLEGSANLNLNNNNTTVGAVALTVGGDNDSTTYSGILSSTVAGGSVTKVGTGALALTGVSTYTGGTTINGGKLLVNGSLASALAVNTGGTLGGSGTVGAVNASGGGTVSPGNSPGILTVAGDFTLQSGHLAIDLAKTAPDSLVAGTDYDQVMVSGAGRLVDLTGGDLDLTLGGNLQIGDVYNIINNVSDTSTFTGTFTTGSINGFAATITNNVISADGFGFQINYGANLSGTAANDISLIAVPVPEPASLGFFAMSLGAAALLTRRRRRKA
jgi:autotransporter-associated beta strand protein